MNEFGKKSPRNHKVKELKQRLSFLNENKNDSKNDINSMMKLNF